jgi:hypothetical protein
MSLFDAKKLWAWAESEDSESWDGPFDSREEAEADCRAHAETDGAETEAELDAIVGYVAEAQHFSAAGAAAAAVDLDRVLEDMNEALDGECSADEYIFDVGDEDHQAASQALEEAVSAWAEKHVRTSSWFQVTGEHIPVRLR